MSTRKFLNKKALMFLSISVLLFSIIFVIQKFNVPEYNRYPPYNSERGLTFPYEFITCGEELYEKDIKQELKTELVSVVKFHILSLNKSDLLISLAEETTWETLGYQSKYDLLKKINSTFRESYGLKSSFVYVVSCQPSDYRWIGYARFLYGEDIIRFDW